MTASDIIAVLRGWLYFVTSLNSNKTPNLSCDYSVAYPRGKSGKVQEELGNFLDIGEFVMPQVSLLGGAVT